MSLRIVPVRLGEVRKWIAAAPMEADVDARLREMVGKVEFRPREDREPLLRMMNVR